MVYARGDREGLIAIERARNNSRRWSWAAGRAVCLCAWGCATSQRHRYMNRYMNQEHVPTSQSIRRSPIILNKIQVLYVLYVWNSVSWLCLVWDHAQEHVRLHTLRNVRPTIQNIICEMIQIGILSLLAYYFQAIRAPASISPYMDLPIRSSTFSIDYVDKPHFTSPYNSLMIECLLNILCWCFPLLKLLNSEN